MLGSEDIACVALLRRLLCATSSAESRELITFEMDGSMEKTQDTTTPAPTAAANAAAETPKRARTTAASRTVEGNPIEVVVDERGVERAIRKLKRKCDTEGVTRELKRRRHYEKPSDRKRRKRRDAERRRRRAARRIARKSDGRR